MINPLSARSFLSRAVGTRIHASTTVDTSLGIKRNFRAGAKRFRIMTPGAVQTASFQKHRRTDTGAIVYGKPFDVKNPTLYITLIPHRSLL
jgi:hypothetical protein